MNAKTTHAPGDLTDFVAEIFASLIRKDQRATSSYYLQGLMLEGRRKSMQPMAERLGIDHQRLQQFVSTSPGVARQYSGTLGKIGKIGNVQIGVSVHAVTDVASCPLDWRLFLPASWDETTAELEEERALIHQRRTKALIPAEIGHRPKWELSVDMIDELHGWGVSPPVVVADAGYGDNGLFRTALTTRGLEYVVQVKGLTSVHPGDVIFDAPEYSGFGRPKKPGYQTPPVQAQELAQSLPITQYRPVSWRQGSKAMLTSRFTAVRVRSANRNLPRNDDGTLPACWY